jgi:hypothetical protein
MSLLTFSYDRYALYQDEHFIRASVRLNIKLSILVFEVY